MAFKFFDSIGVRFLGLALFGTILLSGVAYYLLSFSGNGLVLTSGTPTSVVSFSDAIYFSVVTISSLGYGDYRPIGWSRVLASAEVLAGLFLLTLLIGKLASERQAQIIKLLYTSDHERRLQIFAQDLARYSRVLSRADKEYDDEVLVRVALRGRKLVVGLRSYVVFQTNVGILTYGNRGVFRKVFKRLDTLSQVTLAAARRPGRKPRTRRLLNGLLASSGQVADAVSEINDDPKVKQICLVLSKRVSNYRKQLATAALNGAVVISSPPNEMTDRVLQRVQDSLPPHPWPRNVDKQVAEAIGMSRKFARECIEHLIAQRRVAFDEIPKAEEARNDTSATS
jgi:hypothetical protein